jgi:hypothetical protein
MELMAPERDVISSLPDRGIRSPTLPLKAIFSRRRRALPACGDGPLQEEEDDGGLEPAEEGQPEKELEHRPFSLRKMLRRGDFKQGCR